MTFIELKNGKLVNTDQIIFITPSGDGHGNTIGHAIYMADGHVINLEVEEGDKLIATLLKENNE